MHISSYSVPFQISLLKMYAWQLWALTSLTGTPSKNEKHFPCEPLLSLLLLFFSLFHPPFPPFLKLWNCKCISWDYKWSRKGASSLNGGSCCNSREQRHHWFFFYFFIYDQKKQPLYMPFMSLGCIFGAFHSMCGCWRKGAPCQKKRNAPCTILAFRFSYLHRFFLYSRNECTQKKHAVPTKWRLTNGKINKYTNTHMKKLLLNLKKVFKRFPFYLWADIWLQLNVACSLVYLPNSPYIFGDKKRFIVFYGVHECEMISWNIVLLGFGWDR